MLAVQVKELLKKAYFRADMLRLAYYEVYNFWQ